MCPRNRGRSNSSWSVRLAVAESDAGPISRELAVAWTGEVHRLVMRAGEDGEPDTVTFELDAANAQAARIVAQHSLGKVRAAAGLPVRESPVLWVAPLLGGSESSHRFLSHAEDLVEENAFDLAVVAAQIHLEVQVATLVRRAIAAHSSPLVHALAERQRGWPPHDRWAQPVLEALFDVRMTTFPRWREYNAHVSRRNDVAHGGQVVDRESATDSLRVVSDLWLWLNEAARRAAPA